MSCVLLWQINMIDWFIIQSILLHCCWFSFSLQCSRLKAPPRHINAHRVCTALLVLRCFAVIVHFYLRRLLFLCTLSSRALFPRHWLIWSFVCVNIGWTSDMKSVKFNQKTSKFKKKITTIFSYTVIVCSCSKPLNKGVSDVWLNSFNWFAPRAFCS